MTEDNTRDDLLTQERDSEFDIPNLYGGITIWDHLLKEFEESLIGLGREVFPKIDNGAWPEYRYRYAVAEEFLQIERESKLERTQGFRLADQRRLRDAMDAVAETENVTRERIRQACVQPYDPEGQKEMTQQFLEDLNDLEDQLTAWREQNHE
jgi:tryptophan 2,3-dioxygenase